MNLLLFAHTFRASFLSFSNNKAMTMATGFMVYHSLKSPDVRLNKKERNRLTRELKHSKEVSGFDMPFEKA